MRDTGFSSVFECSIPREPYKPENRLTVVSMKADPIKVSCYPWVNDKAEDEIEAFLGDLEQSAQDHNDKRLSLTQLVKSLINSVMRSFGFEIRRIKKGSNKT